MLDPEALLRHLNCDVEINSYDDGCVTLECNTCGAIILSTKSDPIEKEEETPEFDGSNGDDSEIVNAVFSEEAKQTNSIKLAEGA
jgi:hypothetical protein